jgi:hypothetical protein
MNDYDLSSLPDQPKAQFDLSTLPDQPNKQLKPDLSALPDQPRQPTLEAAPSFMQRYEEAIKNASTDEEFAGAFYGTAFMSALNRYAKLTPQDTAKASNIIALSDQYKMSPAFVADHYDEINQATGMQEQPPAHKFIPQALMIGAGAVSGGLAPTGWYTVANVGKAALGLAGFMAEEEANAFIRSRVQGTPFSQTKPYSLEELAGPDASELTKTTLGAIDILAKAKALHFGYNGLTRAWNDLTLQTLTQNGLPTKFYVDPEQVRSVFAGTAGPQDMEVWRALKVSPAELRAAKGGAFQVELPAEDLVTVTDKPWYAKLKQLLNVSPYSETKATTVGERKFTPVGGLLEEPGKAQPEAPAKTPPGAAAEAPAEASAETLPPSGKAPAAQADLPTAVMMEESGGKDFRKDGTPLTSPTGAKYAMQVLPSTAANPGFGITPAQSDTPEEYNRVGREYLQALYQKYDNNPMLAAAAYNAGPDTVDKLIEKYGDPRTGAISQEDFISKLPVKTDENGKVINDAPTYVRKVLARTQGMQPGAAGIARQDFADAIAKNSNISPEQQEAFMAIADARARSWAETEGRTPEEWYPETLAGVHSGEAPENALAQRTSVLPWPEDFPNAIIHTTLAKLTEHPDHPLAKAGDAEAALRIVDDLIKPERVAELGAAYPDARLLPVHAVEEGGRNKLPRVFAQVISDMTGLPVEGRIGQTNVSAHTAKGAFGRLLSRANFTGEVKPGQKYVIVDDAITQGGTISELRHYIENNGGKVVAVTGLAAGKWSTVIGIKPKTIEAVERKFGRDQTEELLRQYDIAGKLEALTESEGRHILSYAKLDTLRDRIITEGDGASGSAGEGPLATPPAKQEDLLEQTGNPEVFKRVQDILADRAGRPDLEGPTQVGVRKGATQFLEHGKAILHLFETADVSTLIHEFGHILELQLPDEDKAIADAWLKVKPGQERTRAQREKFARGFEAYCAEGVAPSAQLRSVFQKMKQWLLDIYKSIRNLRVRINDDIRAVFDRLLSTEAERKANVLYQMGDEYGSAPEGSLEAQAVERAGRTIEKSEGKVRQRFERDLRKEGERLYGELAEPKMVRDLMAKGLSRKSLETWDDDTVKELMRRWPGLVRKAGGWGVDEAASLYGYEGDDELVKALLSIPTKEQFIQNHIAEGTHAYGDELQLDEIDRLAALVKAEIEILKESEPNMVDLVVATKPEGMWNFIEQEGGRRVSEITADTDYDNLKAAIRMAARNARSAYAAGKREGVAGQKEVGNERLDRTKTQMAERALREKLRQQELLARLKARIAAREEVKRLTAKINKISSATNLPIDYREQIGGILSTVGARQIRVEAPGERLPLQQWVADKEANEGEIFDIPFDILEGIKGKLLRDMTLDELRTLHKAVNEIYTKGRNAGKLLSFADKREVELQATDMAARIAEHHSAKSIEGRSIKYDGRVYPLFPTPGMSEADVNVVYGLQAILTFGSKADAIEGLTEALSPKPAEQPPDEVINNQNVSYAAQPAEEEIPDEMRADLERQLAAVRSLDESKIKMPPATLRPWAVRESRIRRIMASGDRMLSQLLEMETVLSWADGFTEDFGPNWTGIYKTVNDGYNNLYRLNNEDLPAFEEILKPFKTKIGGLSTWANKKYSFPELGGVSLTKMEMMSWALNMGNEGNYNALKRSFKVNGRSLSDEQVRVVVNKLSPEEWEAVVKLGRLVDSLERFNQMTGVYETVTGNRLTKVEGWKVDTPAGQVDGWYYPLIDDPAASYKMEKRFAANENRDLFSTRYNPKSPRSGFTIQRRQQAEHIIDVNFPAVIGRFIQDRNRYISLTLPVRDAQKLANNDTWRQTVESYLGRDFHRMVMPWLQDMARPMSADTTFVERIMGGLRRRATMVHIGLKIITAVKHYPMLTTTIDRVGLTPVAKAMSVYMRHPIYTRAFIEARSPFMKGVLAKWDRDIGEQWRNFDPERSEAKALVTKAAFTPIDIVIGQVGRITWMAGYKKAMDSFGWDEAKAVDYADKAVRDTIGTFEPKDLATVRRGSDLRKLFTMFYPYGATLFQREFERAAQVGMQGTTGTEREPGSKWWRGISALYSFFWLLGIAAFVEQMLSKRRPPENAGEAAKGVAAAAANSVPFVRDVVGAAMGERPYEISPAAGLGHSVTELAKPWFTGKSMNWNKYLFENAMTALGYAFDLPTDQMATTAEGIANQGQPGYEPWNMLIKPPAPEYGPRRRHGRR